MTRGLNRVVVTTAPPLSPIAGALLTLKSRVRVIFWAMDLNPDQLVALGVLRPAAWPVRVLDWFNRVLIRRAAAVVACDRHMAERIRRKADPDERLIVIPPWAHDRHLERVAHEENPFRSAHGMIGKRVIMYSGNHAITNPLSTLLAAAKRLVDEERLVFVFVGGGAGKREVEANAASNIVSLPYQPLDKIKFSLSAGDVHVATMGENVVGIVHPCKVYGAMALGRPILTFGPAECHLADLAERGIGWHVRLGDVAGAEKVLREIAHLSEADLTALGDRARDIAHSEFESTRLRQSLCDTVVAEHVASAAPPR